MEIILIDALDGFERCRTSTTGFRGEYEFVSNSASCVMRIGDRYRIVLDVQVGLLAGLTVSPRRVGSDSALDSDLIAPMDGSRFGVIDIVSDGRDKLNLDAGFGSAALSIGDFVWLDSNADGVQDRGEPGIGGVIVQLLLQDRLVQSVVTDSSGLYLFGRNLRPRTNYTVRIALAQSAIRTLIPTRANAFIDDTRDSDGTLTSSRDAVQVQHLTEDRGGDASIDFGFSFKV